jgi:hypothetical protein
MGEAARAWICSHYSDERVLRLAVSFYKSLLKLPPARKVSSTHALVVAETRRVHRHYVK